MPECNIEVFCQQKHLLDGQLAWILYYLPHPVGISTKDLSDDGKREPGTDEDLSEGGNIFGFDQQGNRLISGVAVHSAKLLKALRKELLQGYSMRCANPGQGSQPNVHASLISNVLTSVNAVLKSEQLSSREPFGQAQLL